MLLWKIIAKFLAVIFFALGILRRAGMVLERSDKRILRLFALDGFFLGKFPVLAPDCVLIFASFYDSGSKRPSVSGPWKAGFLEECSKRGKFAAGWNLSVQ